MTSERGRSWQIWPNINVRNLLQLQVHAVEADRQAAGGEDPYFEDRRTGVFASAADLEVERQSPDQQTGPIEASARHDLAIDDRLDRGAPSAGAALFEAKDRAVSAGVRPQLGTIEGM